MELTSVLLQIIASTAIAIAGFSGVVVALTGKSTERFKSVRKTQPKNIVTGERFRPGFHNGSTCFN